MTINKYYLYIVILLLAVLPTLGPKLYYRLTYERTTGTVVGYYTQESRTKPGISVTKYPVVLFHTANAEVTFYAPPFMSGITSEGHAVQVLYNKKDPTKAFVNSSLGLFGPNLVWLLPLFLMFTGCFFAPGIIPVRIRLSSKEIDKKLFG
jgi:hypothetical protein